jgi:hypothetical protein
LTVPGVVDCVLAKTIADVAPSQRIVWVKRGAIGNAYRSRGASIMKSRKAALAFHREKVVFR